MPKVDPTNIPATAKAQRTGRWAEIIFKAVNKPGSKRWQFLSFLGPNGGSSRGIVDVLGVRRNTAQPRHRTLKRYDLFDFVLVQVKGGSAKRPTPEDLRRLREVRRHYRAQRVVLFEWLKGKKAVLSVLGPDLKWTETTRDDVFG